MVKIKIRYLVAKKQKGHVLYYWQPTKELQAEGFTTRRLSDPSNNELEAVQQAQALNTELDAWRAGEIEDISLKPGTVSWLINEYQTSDRFFSLRDATRESYIYYMKRIDEWAGDMPFDKLTRLAVRAKLNSYGDKKRTRKAIYQMGRLLYNFAKDLGLASENPFEKHYISSNPPRKQIWTQDDETRFMEAAKSRPSIKLALALAADTGQRQTDLLRLTWSQYDGQYLNIRQSKTNVAIFIPVTARLKSLLDNTPKKSMQILVNEETNKPYRKDNFGHLFKKFMNNAGIDKDKQFRDLRRTAVVNLGRAGCSNIEIASFTGHSLDDSSAILEVYLPKDTMLADSGILKLEKYRKNPSNSEKGS